MIRGRGGPEVLHVEEREVPSPGSGQVRITVAANGIAFGDVMRRRGVLAPPWAFTPGYDVVGTIDKLGAGVTGWSEGDMVAAMLPGPGFGAYADHVVVGANRLAPVPDGLDPAVAVALGLNYITAWQLIHRFCALQAGQKLLVHGAAGGVGTATLDIAKLQKLEVFGTASKRKHGFLTDRDCTPIDYRSEDFVQRIGELAPGGVDAVIDGVGGSHLKRSYEVLNPAGFLVSLGVSGDVGGGMLGVVRGFLHFLSLKLRWNDKTVRLYSITSSTGASWDECRDDWAELMRLGAAGKIEPVIGARVPLEEVREAHRMMDEAAVAGKLVLTR